MPTSLDRQAVDYRARALFFRPNLQELQLSREVRIAYQQQEERREFTIARELLALRERIMRNRLANGVLPALGDLKARSHRYRLDHANALHPRERDQWIPNPGAVLRDEQPWCAGVSLETRGLFCWSGSEPYLSCYAIVGWIPYQGWLQMHVEHIDGHIRGLFARPLSKYELNSQAMMLRRLLFGRMLKRQAA